MSSEHRAGQSLEMGCTTLMRSRFLIGRARDSGLHRLNILPVADLNIHPHRKRSAEIYIHLYRFSVWELAAQKIACDGFAF